MRRPNPSRTLLLGLVLLLWIVPVAHGQGKPGAATPEAPAKAHRKARAPRRAVERPAAAGLRETSASAAVVIRRRDPFQPLIVSGKPGVPVHLPPGKAGLVISTLTVEGVVSAPSGMIAVVSNPEQRVYFIREGDQLYDGRVGKITLDGVTFDESTKDAFGRPVERTVMKRIYPIVGEQQ